MGQLAASARRTSCLELDFRRGRPSVSAAGNSTDILFSVLGGSTSTFIDSSGTGNLAFTNTGNIANFANTQAIALTLTGNNTGLNTFAPRIVDFCPGQFHHLEQDRQRHLGADEREQQLHRSDFNISGGILGATTLANGGSNSSIGASSSFGVVNLVLGAAAFFRASRPP